MEDETGRPLKTLHVVYSFPPDPPGGTEVYVGGLCRRLQDAGIEAVVAAPAAADARYRWEGLRVVRYAGRSATLDLEALYAEGDPVAIASFERVLDLERPDLVHLHALTAGCPPALARHARARGVPVVLTYHTPTVTCQRGTLLRWGMDECDGIVDPVRCAACTLHHLGGPRWTSRLVAHVPEEVGDALGRRHLSGGPWTALRMRSLIAARKRALQTLFAACDRVIAPSDWAERVLLLNGVPRDRIARSRHGVDAPRARRQAGPRDPGAPLRLAHLTRLDPAKGTDILLHAVRALPSARLELDIFAVAQGPEATEYGARLRGIAGTDRRIRFATAVEPPLVIDLLQGYDFIAVPSQVLETGPLVALEAFAAGVPVIGSALGGLLENVRDGVDGLLVTPHGSPAAWSLVLARCVEDRALVTRLRASVRPPRTMADVAREMAALYRGVLRSRGSTIAQPLPAVSMA